MHGVGNGQHLDMSGCAEDFRSSLLSRQIIGHLLNPKVKKEKIMINFDAYHLAVAIGGWRHVRLMCIEGRSKEVLNEKGMLELKNEVVFHMDGEEYFTTHLAIKLH